MHRDWVKLSHSCPCTQMLLIQHIMGNRNKLDQIQMAYTIQHSLSYGILLGKGQTDRLTQGPGRACPIRIPVLKGVGWAGAWFSWCLWQESAPVCCQGPHTQFHGVTWPGPAGHRDTDGTAAPLSCHRAAGQMLDSVGNRLKRTFFHPGATWCEP